MAAGELREETGLISESLLYVGHVFQAYGYSNQGFHIFLATGLTSSNQDLDAEEEGLITKSFSLDEFEAMIVAGKIKDATTISAYGLVKMKQLVIRT